MMNANPTWHSHEFYAMGCHMCAWLELPDETVATGALRQIEALFHVAEARMTRFSAESELSQLNAQPNRWVALSQPLWTVIRRALLLAEQTDGLFDPTLLNALTGAGYTTTFAAMHGEATVEQEQKTSHRTYQPRVPQRGRWREVELDAGNHAIRLPSDLRLDLGGIGKGFTAQQAVTFLNNWGPCLVDAGGDLVAGDAPQGLPGWSVAIAAPSPEEMSTGETSSGAINGEHDLMQLWLKNATLATSGIDYRRWQQDGRMMHHLIDPRTGKPAQSTLLTASVLAADATVAEAWATALMITGPKDESTLPPHIAAAYVDRQQRLTVTQSLLPFVQNEYKSSMCI